MRIFSVSRSAVGEPALTLEPAVTGLLVAPPSTSPPARPMPHRVEKAEAGLGHRLRSWLWRNPDPAGRPGSSSEPDGIPVPDRAAARIALDLPVDVPLYAALGPLGRAAGPDRLWRAWAAVRRRSADAQLLVLADGPVPALPGVRAVGAVASLATHLDACDAVLVLARQPGLPEPAADALGRGVPLIVSREAAGDGGAPDGSTAQWVVDGDHPAQIAEALLARRMGTAQWLHGATVGVRVGPPPPPQAS